jgi:dihydrofolate reductase
VRELTADLFISLDGFASGMNEPPLFGYHGEDLMAWIRENLEKPQTLIMGRVTYAALAQFAVASNDELNLRMDGAAKGRVLKHASRPAHVEEHALCQNLG